MKREEIKSLLENSELDVDAKLKAIMDLNGKDLNDLKASNKELETKAKTVDELTTKLEESNKTLETYKNFEEKAKQYDSISADYEALKKDAHVRKYSDAARKAGIKEEFIEFSVAKVGDLEDESKLDEAFKNFADNNKQYTTSVEKVIDTNGELGGGKKAPTEDLSKIY